MSLVGELRYYRFLVSGTHILAAQAPPQNVRSVVSLGAFYKEDHAS